MSLTSYLNVVILLLAGCVLEGETLKILVVSPVFGRSHSQFMGNLADFYVENGHEVVFFEPIVIDDDPILISEFSKKARVIKKQKDWTGTHAFSIFKNQGWEFANGNILDVFNSLKGFTDALAKSCDSILNDEQLLSMLRNEKFDIGIAEYLTVCPYALYRKIGVEKYITASATPVGASFVGIFGVASLPTLSHVPEFFNPPSAHMSFLNRLGNVLTFFSGNVLFNQLFLRSVVRVVNEHYPEMNMQEMLGKSSYVFINSNEHLDFVRGSPSKFINVAGIGVPEPKDLPEDYQKFMDTSKKGVILVSFGSIAQSQKMPSHIKQAFLDTFDQFPDIEFIWKYENSSENIAAGHTNVWTREWTPQVSLFNHKNLIGFVTHGGMNSLIEASTYGIPSICIAIFGDQTRNCNMFESRGLVINLPKTELAKETIVAALHALIRDETHLKKARTISQMLKNMPMSAKQRVLQYTTFATEFNISSNLDSIARQLNIVEFYNLDVFAFIALILFAVLFVFAKIVALTIRCLSRLTRNSNVKNKKE